MASLFRHSQVILTRVACVRRTAATTSTSGGGTTVRPSGASTNLSEASRAADGTDMAMRDAQQRGTASDSTKSTSTGGQSQSPKTGTSSPPWGKIGAGVLLLFSAYFVFTKYIQNPGFSQTLKTNTAVGSKDAHENPADRDGYTSKKNK